MTLLCNCRDVKTISNFETNLRNLTWLTWEMMEFWIFNSDQILYEKQSKEQESKDVNQETKLIDEWYERYCLKSLYGLRELMTFTR